MNLADRRKYRKIMNRRAETFPSRLTPVPMDEWPQTGGMQPAELWASRRYIVQVFHEAAGVTRISVNRAHVGQDGHWVDGITWDDLQQIKRDIGRGDAYAIEIYPPDRDVILDANMRHLWIPAEPLDIGWKRQ